MTVELFLMLLTTLSFATSLLTEGVKKFLDVMKIEYASNIVVLIVAVVVGGVGTSIFYIWNNFEWTTLNVICMFLMMAANWLGAMLGYDKVTQAIEQIKGKIRRN